ncbi:MAG: DUF6065 family protein [Burkholderiales bacterium]
MTPLATFHRFVPDTLMPMRADRAALGTLPTAALQYCEAITSASAFGWYGFPPISFHVQWDGTNFLWTHDDADSWFPLRSEHFPGFDVAFDGGAPEDLRGFAPPFLTALPQPGVLQLWTGVMVRTRPGWSLLVRPPANLARSRDYEPYEGIIETDRWFYPLFINLRIIAADRPIFFDRNRPLLQAQPMLRQTYDEAELRTATFVDGLEGMSDRDWDDFRASIGARAKEPMMRPGRYAADVRKRASREGCPYAHADAAD